MARKRLQRFADNAQRHNVIQPGKDIYQQIKGKCRGHFNNDNDIVLELACGRGEYSIGLARILPGKNFVGVDIKGSRLWKGSKYAIENDLNNVAFLRTHILNLGYFFEKKEVSEIWIPFPDPRPGKRDIKRRLTSPRFLDIYRDIIKPGCPVHLKTDNKGFFEYTLSVLEQLKIKDVVCTSDLYSSDLLNDHHGIKTKYEKDYLAEGLKIFYLRFRFP